MTMFGNQTDLSSNKDLAASFGDYAPDVLDPLLDIFTLLSGADRGV